MREFRQHINEAFGATMELNPIKNNDLKNLPMYIIQAYNLYTIDLFNQELLEQNRKIMTNGTSFKLINTGI
ncbi:hypothetical protein [Flavobacterium gilvum]|uniref:Uncharacterized protein n=1 Tax=Flavobacterium gilvum TaxID=1492737 RepID=A0AAC9I768_9FLAO|nr:hypothetical protein [Flavobacterium gilvum]AOW11025.1 hypothetical protein EM308_16880 [Flavobacterium gilvum]KFC59175.1 hypothetical protein FEM08_20360 [Flavobacterium gilvum]